MIFLAGEFSGKKGLLEGKFFPGLLDSRKQGFLEVYFTPTLLGRKKEISLALLS